MALALIGGIIIGEGMFGANFLFRLIPLFVLLAGFVVFVILKKTRRFAYLFVAALVGLLAICGSGDVFAKNTKIGEYAGYMTARVSSEIRIEWDEDSDKDVYYFFVEDLYAGDTELKYDGYVKLTSEDEPDYNAGDIIRIYGYLTASTHTKFDSFHAYDVAKKEGYLIIASSVEKLSEGKLHLLERIPYKIKSNFYSRLDEDTAAICTALVIGDKEGLDEDLHDDISASGLAHLLAVSGLHISVLSAALFFILRKCKLNAKICWIVVFLATLFYCFLCDFTASSLRALIMMTVINLSSAFGRKRDTLSSISFAAVLILIFRPTALFEAGFLMSFSAVIGITCYFLRFHHIGMKAVNKLSPKKHIGTRLSRAIALSLSANIATYPFVAYFFGEVPVLFVVSNVIVLPYLMFIYVFLLINTVLSLIVGWTGNMLMFKYLLFPFRAYVGAVGSLSFATIPVTISIVGIVAFIIVFMLLSRFVFLKRTEKLVGALAVCTIALVTSAVVTLASAKPIADVEDEAEAFLIGARGLFSRLRL